MKLEGKTAIVTGGANGIGYAIVSRFLREEAQVVIADVDEENGRRAVEDLKDFGKVVFYPCDVGERLDVHNLVAKTHDEFGDIDILVNNAGIARTGDFLQMSEDDFDAVLRVNLKGAFLASQAVSRQMIGQAGEEDGAGGTIINMSSTNAELGVPSHLPYTVAVGGIRQLTTVLAQYLAPHGIRVNAIGPGTVNTDMLANAATADPKLKKRLLARTPMGRFAEPSEIAGIATFLASSDASYITGQTIYADGGRLGQAFPTDE